MKGDVANVRTPILDLVLLTRKTPTSDASLHDLFHRTIKST